MAHCHKCGAELPKNGGFCEYCGSAAEPARSSFDREENVCRPYAGGPIRGDGPRFKKSSVIGMILCTIFTRGLYPSIWYILRLRTLEKLDPTRYKYTHWIIKGFMAAHIIYICSAYVAELQSVRELFFYADAGLWVCASFAVRAMLCRYAERVSPGNPINVYIAESEAWTLLFGIFYLQTQINWMINTRLLEAKL